MTVMKFELASGKALPRPVAVHPVPRLERERLSIGLRLPLVHLLIFCAACKGSCCPDVIAFDDELEIAAGMFKNC